MTDALNRIAALNEWRAGRVPLWNPYVSGGVPFPTVE